MARKTSKPAVELVADAVAAERLEVATKLLAAILALVVAEVRVGAAAGELRVAVAMQLAVLAGHHGAGLLGDDRRQGQVGALVEHEVSRGSSATRPSSEVLPKVGVRKPDWRFTPGAGWRK